MLCDVCKDSVEGMCDPLRTKRLGLVENFPSALDRLLRVTKSSGSEIEKYVFGHHETRDSFLRSKARGYVQCSRVMEKDDMPMLGYFSTFVVYISSKGTPCIIMRYGSQSSVLALGSCGGNVLLMRWRMRTRLVDTDMLEDPRLDHGLNFALSPSTAHTKTWDLVLRWFSTCTKFHTECSAPRIDGTFKPSRILEVDKTGEAISFRLVDGTECAIESAYVTLSYCWGSQPASEAYRLLKSTVQCMRSKQSATILPKTIQDAMTIALRLQIRYLWVDRLCIFQDSAEDFQMEASSMVDVYKNAVLNIAALGARDADGGCFFDRNPRYVAPTRVHVQLDQYSSPKPFQCVLEKDFGWQPSFETEPLVHLAWTVQERLLARRVVYFGSKQVFWEWKGAHCCETNPNNIRVLDDRGRSRVTTGSIDRGHFWKHLLCASFQHHFDNPYSQLLADWRAIVTSFSKCALTEPSDTLVALSGLANDMKRMLDEFRPAFRHRYVAGLWEVDLPGALAWSVSEPAHRAPTYRAPTWSWASIDGPVGWQGRPVYSPHTCFSTIAALEVKQRPGEAETGRIENASITLLGPILRAKLRSTTRQKTTFSASFAGTGLREGLDVSSQACRDGESMAQLEIPDSTVTFDTLDDIRHDFFEVIIRSTLNVVEGIAIVSSDLEANTYRRVGFFQCTFLTRSNAMDTMSRGISRDQVFVAKFSKRSVVIV